MQIKKPPPSRKKKTASLSKERNGQSPAKGREHQLFIATICFFRHYRHRE